MIGRKEEFNQWLKSVLNNLKGQYINCDLDIGTKSLQKKHWYQLWRIFESLVECPYQDAKERMGSLDEADYEAREVILKAHGQSSIELDWNILMDHYMNSVKYG